MTKRGATWLSRIALAAGGLLTAAAGLELYLRRVETYVVETKPVTVRLLDRVDHNPEHLIRYTREGRRLVPGANVVIRNHYLSRRDVPMQINSLGLRRPELPLPGESRSTRILILGDSITWGDYLVEEETFVRQTESRLRSNPGVDSVTVLNGGVADVGIREELVFLDDRGSEIRPDIVVLAFYLNDGRPPRGFAAEHGGRGWLRRTFLLADTIYRQLILSYLIQDARPSRHAWALAPGRLSWQSDRAAFLELARLARFDWGSAWQDDTWHYIDVELGRLASLARRHGFPVLVAALPVSFQVLAGFVEDSPQRILADLSKKHGFRYLDLLPILRAHREESLFYDHCHLKPAANVLVGEAIAAALIEGGLVTTDGQM